MQAIGIPASQSASQLAGALADRIGLPSPQTPTERVVADASRMAAGGFTGASAAQGLSRATTGVTREVAQRMAQGPLMQSISMGSAGLAGGAVREAGGSNLEQFAASLAGGLVGPYAANAARAGSLMLRDMVTPPTFQAAEQRAQIILQNAGIDWNALNGAARMRITEDINRALRVGDDLSPQAVARLASMRNVPGFTPTRGMVTQDPVQITRERNLAKSMANLGTLTRLPRVESENATALNDALGNLGATRALDDYATGSAVTGDLSGRIAAADRAREDAYAAARAMAGRDLLLDGQQFGRDVVAKLREKQVFAFLPEDTRNLIQNLANGTEPFTVDAQQQFIKMMNARIRSTSDGNIRTAYGVVRGLLEDLPLAPQQAAPAGQTVANALPNPTLGLQGAAGPSQQQIGQDIMDAFARARETTRNWRQTVERTPALQALEAGAEPDKFARDFILGNSPRASVRAISELLNVTEGSGTREVLRNYILGHLARKARPGETNVFNARSYNDALVDIGDAKLRLFFDEREIRQLRDVGRAGQFATGQPAGSAVGNSNTAAAQLGRLSDLGSFFTGSQIPVVSQLSGAFVSAPMALRALSPATAVNRPLPLVENALIPGGLSTLLLSSQVGNDRQDNQGR
jgi:hypothetical protein